MLRWTDPEQIQYLTMDPKTTAVIRHHQDGTRPGDGAVGQLPVLRVHNTGTRTVPNVIGVHLYLERDGEILLGLRHPDSAYAPFGAEHHRPLRGLHVVAAHRRGPLGESPPAAGVVTALAGRNLHGTVLDRATEARMHRGLGELAAAFRHSARPRTPPPRRPHLSLGEVGAARSPCSTSTTPPLRRPLATPSNSTAGACPPPPTGNSCWTPTGSNAGSRPTSCSISASPPPPPGHRLSYLLYWHGHDPAQLPGCTTALRTELE